MGLEEMQRLERPIKMTIRRKGKEELRLYFETPMQAQLFHEFIQTVIKAVMEKSVNNAQGEE